MVGFSVLHVRLATEREDPSGLEPGQYRLTEEMKNSETGELETRDTPLTIASHQAGTVPISPEARLPGALP